MVPRLDVRDPGMSGDALDVVGNIRPGSAAVARDLDVAVIGAHPDHLFVPWRFIDGVDRAVVFSGRIIDG